MNCDLCNKKTPNELFGLSRNIKEYLFVCKECRQQYNICYCGSCSGNGEKW